MLAVIVILLTLLSPYSRSDKNLGVINVYSVHLVSTPPLPLWWGHETGEPRIVRGTMNSINYDCWARITGMAKGRRAE